MKKILLLFVIFLLVGCADTTTEKIEQLRVGMTEAEAIELLGEPYVKHYDSDYNKLKYTYYSGKEFNQYKQSLNVNIRNGKVYSWY